MTQHIPIHAAPTIASLRAAWEAEVVRTNRIVGGTRSQAGYAECLAIARSQIDAAKTWQRAILFDLLRENLTGEYADAVGDIEYIMDCDGNCSEGEAIMETDRLRMFALEKYAIAEAKI